MYRFAARLSIAAAFVAGCGATYLLGPAPDDVKLLD